MWRDARGRPPGTMPEAPAHPPRYGPQWEDFLDSGPAYFRIEAERMFAIDVNAASSRYPDS